MIEGGRIVSVGPAGKLKLPKSARVIDYAGKTVLPGLISDHSHFGQMDGTQQVVPSAPVQKFRPDFSCRIDGSCYFNRFPRPMQTRRVPHSRVMRVGLGFPARFRPYVP